MIAKDFWYFSIDQYIELNGDRWMNFYKLFKIIIIMDMSLWNCVAQENVQEMHS